MREVTEPRLVVTVKNGKGTRRYLVDRVDEHVFDHLPEGNVDPDAIYGASGRGFFGCQWLRAKNAVDEMHRTLSLHEVVRFTRTKPVTIRWPY